MFVDDSSARIYFVYVRPSVCLTCDLSQYAPSVRSLSPSLPSRLDPIRHRWTTAGNTPGSFTATGLGSWDGTAGGGGVEIVGVQLSHGHVVQFLSLVVGQQVIHETLDDLLAGRGAQG